MTGPIQGELHLLYSFIMAQKTEHKNIPWKVKCSVLNVEETMKQGVSINIKEGGRHRPIVLLSFLLSQYCSSKAVCYNN